MTCGKSGGLKNILRIWGIQMLIFSNQMSFTHLITSSDIVSTSLKIFNYFAKIFSQNTCFGWHNVPFILY